MRIAVVNSQIPERLCRIILSIPEYDIAWTADNGAEAIKQCIVDRPDLLLIDPELPGLDGVETTRRIMEQTPCPILIVTQAIDRNAAKVFKAIGCGAVDAVNAPSLGNDDQAKQSRKIFLKKIRTIIRLHGKEEERSLTDTLRSQTETHRFQSEPSSSQTEKLKKQTASLRRKTERFRAKTEAFRLSHLKLPPLVVIGSSTGGPKTLVNLFSQLPKDLEAAIIVVQHLDQEFSAGLAEWLNSQTPLQVRVAEKGTHPKQGIIDVAGTNDHLALTAGLTFVYTPEPYDNPYRPSVDVFFESVAKYWPEPGCAILLTGMGRDGAVELANLRSLGWHTIAQDQATSIVYGMPKAAKELDAAVEILPIEYMGPAILKFAKKAPT